MKHVPAPHGLVPAFALPALALLPAQLVQHKPQPIPNKAPFAVLTDNRVEVTNFNPEPFSGLAFDSLGNLWAVNPYASTIVGYDAIQAAPDIVIPTGLNPVSVAVWETGPAPEEHFLIVACAGTHALLMHDPVTGRVLDLVRVDSEPADLVLDHDNGWAFVSCQGENTVVKVDLVTFTVADTYVMARGERPGPLYLDTGVDADPLDNRVYVAAQVSGNNSVTSGNVAADTVGFVLDLDTVPGTGLPDEDVYRIDPFTDTVASVVKRAGSLLFDLERNPLGGDLWILSFDSNNKDASIDSEPLLRGKIGTNQLVRVAGVGATSGLITALDGIDLDDFDPLTSGAQYAADRSLNQAHALDILSGSAGAQGFAFVAGPMSDVIAILNPQGERILDMNLPAGAQCHDLEIWPLDERLFACLCLGTMTIELFSWSPFSADPIASLPLGLDPTPAQIRRGRAVFLDGQRSQDARFSCASCHPNGLSDQLGWMLRGHPTDEKDVMVTQSLLSIADSFPHHWRGERDLEDFRKAFPGLLGDPSVPSMTDPASDQVVADFVVFLQSLQGAANPIEDPQRIVNDAVTASAAPNGMHGSAVDGQTWFRTIENFNGQTCEGCHQQQSGTDGAFLDEVSSFAPRVAELEVAHLRQLTAKLEDTVTITIGSNQRLVNEEGFGAAHSGRLASVFNFIFDIQVFDALSDQQQVDVFMLMKQLDQGISPAVHWAARLGLDNVATSHKRIERVLIDGAEKGWNDVAIFGEFDDGSGLATVRWWFDAAAALLVPDVPGMASLTWPQYVAATQAGDADGIVLGLPPSNGRRFALDHDADGLVNGEEAVHGTDAWVADEDGDGWPDGYEVLHGDEPLIAQPASSDGAGAAVDAATLDHTTSRMAKYHVRFDEDATYTVSYGSAGFPQRTFVREYFSREDTLVLPFDEPSPPNVPGGIVFPPLTFQAQISLVDRAGNPSGPFNLVDFDAGEAAVQLPLLGNHVADMQWTQQDRIGAALHGQVQVRIDTNYIDTRLPSPTWITQPAVMVFCILAVHDAATDTWSQSTSFSTTLATTFDIVDAGGNVQAYEFEPGPPWLVSGLTDAAGQTTIDFVQPALAPGQRLKLVVMGTAALPPLATAPPFQSGSLFTMQPLFQEGAMEIELPGGF